MQEWIVAHGRRLVVLFEGRDTAGKDGVIKRITEYLNPRTCRVVGAARRRASASARGGTSRATPRELPAAGEIVLFNRSWYNRAGVERVMGFCTRRGVRGVPALLPAVRAARSRTKASRSSSTGCRSATTSRSAASRSGSRTRASAGSSARSTCRRAPAGSTTPKRRTACSPAPTREHEPVVRGRGRRQAHRPAEPDQPPALAASRTSSCRRPSRSRLPPRQQRPYERPPQRARTPVPELRSALSGKRD